MATLPDWSRLREDLKSLHRAALAAADPERAVGRALRVSGDTIAANGIGFVLAHGIRPRLVAFGKASLAMTRAVVSLLGGRLEAGVVAYPRAVEPSGDWPSGFRFFPAGHPIPDAGSLAAGDAALALVRDATPDDLILVLVSGGGSALLEALHPGVELDDLQALTVALQHSGADIVELNTVRRALSRIKGGGLARAARPARVLALLLSDVMGDRLDAIASGPTVPSPTGTAEALAILERRELAARFPGVVTALRTAADAQGSAASPLASGNAAHAGDRDRSQALASQGGRSTPSAAHVLVGSNRLAAEALAAEAERRGFRARIMTDHLQGEAREVGRMIGGMASSVRASALPIGPPACLIFGGETTVTVHGNGRGGRNQETALGAALALAGVPRAAVFSFGTDGIDGPTDAAGAFATGETLVRAAELGLSPHEALTRNDAEPFFRALGDLWVTGPTGTNVNDLAVALVYP